jgi:formylglycine-generating enzyme required for sulfatase activity
MRARLALLLLASGCADPLGAWPWDQDMGAWRDQDGDGHTATGRGGFDCDDLDPSVHPGAQTVEQGHMLAMMCAGTFAMGSPEDEVGRGEDEGRHPVTLTQSFLLGVLEVSQVQFESIMGYQPSPWPGCLHCPVESVSWHMAVQFTNLLSYEAGLDSCYDCAGFGDGARCEPIGEPYGCEGFRLPTEAEWELGARAGTASAFSSRGDLFPGDTSNCGGGVILDNSSVLDQLAWYCGDDDGRPSETATRDPNPWGLSDVHGNVWEWTHDWYGPYDSEAWDPWGPEAGTQRVKRGGAWSSYPQSLRSAGRSAAEPGVVTDTIGFRVARTLTGD